MIGEVGILNVGAGDTKLVFDPSNPEDMTRAARIVKDMLRRGYALLVAVGSTEKGEPTYRRAHDFDETTCEYIIVGVAPEDDQDAASTEMGSASREASREASDASASARLEDVPGVPAAKRVRKTKQRIPASRAKATAVARTAGG
jgi:hypothetical protein